MITINDNDLPITAAQKLITGTRPNEVTPLLKAAAKALTGNENAADTSDMFTIDELREIADYLYVYCNSHIMGD